MDTWVDLAGNTHRKRDARLTFRGSGTYTGGFGLLTGPLAPTAGFTQLDLAANDSSLTSTEGGKASVDIMLKCGQPLEPGDVQGRITIGNEVFATFSIPAGGMVGVADSTVLQDPGFEVKFEISSTLGITVYEWTMRVYIFTPVF